MSLRWAVPVLLAVGAVVVLLLLQGGDPDRARRERAPVAREGMEETQREPAPESPSSDAPDPPKRLRGRLVDPQGGPGADLRVYLAAGFPLETHTFRSGTWPARTVWLCPFTDEAQTGSDGSFTLPAGRAGARHIVYTPSSSPLHLVAEVPGGTTELRAEGKCVVSGVLRDRAGNALARTWIEGQRGPREDWHVRIEREKPMYVSPGGPIGIDEAAPVGTEADDEGRFSFPLRPGPCTIAFGEQAEFGTLPVHVRGTALDLGEIRLPLDPAPAGEGTHELVVRVYDAQGAPRADAEVLLWDGVVGPPSHSEWTDADGFARFDGLRADEVMAWTVPVDRPYLAEPEQCSGRVRMPCEAPVALRARRPGEYVVLRFRERGWGYCLLLQGDRLLGGVDTADPDGLAVPPGDYHAIVVGRRVVLEGDLPLRGADEVVVDREQLVVTMRG